MTTNSTAKPDWLDTGDNAWQLTAASLVALQSIPGLVVLYAGIMKAKWAINSAFMAFYAFASVLFCWCVWAYKVAFGDQMLPIAGYPGPVLSIEQELSQAILPAAGLAPNFPLSTMIYFQFAFAAITVVLLAGAVLGRMNFFAWMIFVPLWLSFSYCIGAFSLWGGGWAYQMGILDYSGGYVIHVSSGSAGFVAAWWVGPRLAADRLNDKPHNLMLVLVGAGILWVGWNGFNGGDPYAASTDAGAAVINTNLCTAFSMLCWMVCDMVYYKKPSVIGAVQGMITGLVGITPAAGLVAGWGAIAIGFATGTIPWVTMNIMGKKVKFFRDVDDTLGIFHTHLVAGFVGGMCTGLFATIEGCAAFGVTNLGGAIAGNGKQVWLQLVGALFIMGWNMVATSIIMVFIRYVLRIPLRMSEETLIAGDDAVHGEIPYIFNEDESLLENADFNTHAQSNIGGELGVTEGMAVDDGPHTTHASGSKNGGSGSDEVKHEH